MPSVAGCECGGRGEGVSVVVGTAPLTGNAVGGRVCVRVVVGRESV